MRNRSSFTLIEIMIVVVVIGLLASVVSVSVLKHLKKVRIETTRANIGAIKTGIKTYELDLGKRPTTLQELVKEGDENWPGPFLDSEEVPKDGWGRDFRYTIKGKRVEVRSAGPDGILDNEDDITK